MAFEPVLTNHVREKLSYTLDFYVAKARGYEGLRKALAQKLSRFTGVSPQFIEASNLRVNSGRFRKELLRDQRLMVGRLDSRFTGMDADAAGEQQEYDP